ncbi:MFS transporter [Actinocorallia sp. A-T 12471]|uniref:MFS transporter n=1 Tax=Actinocorallia sp. A-T 12471 TaxID=3089813 RepID=UPI0029CDF06D|nr:MFS transporter [Actinocorallia sp. A-T 12471]MDX6741641.1 MFS transporter [Actinocorallia sp. A-T 12471]
MNPSARLKYLAGMVVDATGSGMYLPLSLLYFHHVVGLPLTAVGALLTGAALLSLAANPFAGVLVDRFGARAVVVGCYTVRAAGFAAYPFVDSAASMLLATALVALGDGAYPPSVQAFVAEIARGAARDGLLAAQRGIRNAGLGAGGLIAGAALALGSDAAYQGIVATTAAAHLTAALIFRTIPVPGRAAHAGRVARGYRLVLRDRPFRTLTLLNLPIAFGYMVLSVALPVYATRHLGLADSYVGVLFAVNTAGIALLQIPATRAVVRHRRTRAAAAGALTFAAAFVAFCLLDVFASGAVLVVGVFAATLVFTVGELLHGATASALVASAAPEATRGRHLAVYQLSWALPTALSPFVLTSLLAWSVPALWLTLAATVTLSAFTLLRLEPRLPLEAVYAVPPVVGGGVRL